MNTTLKKILIFLFALLCIAIGSYPVLYWIADEPVSILLTKTPDVLADSIWKVGFYGHITAGGIAMLSGWSQFLPSIRNKYIDAHRILGKIYVVTALISGICAVYIAFYASTGTIATIGFGLLGMVWLITTVLAYRAVLRSDLTNHQRWMIYSYAACFAAVTLRIWLPLLTSITGDFNISYPIVAWLCWVPNLAVAHVVVMRIKSPVG